MEPLGVSPGLAFRHRKSLQVMLLLTHEVGNVRSQMTRSSSATRPVVPLYHPTSILLVDDDQVSLTRMQHVLKDGFECLAFQRAADALAFIRSRPAAPPMPAACHDAGMEHIRDPAERQLHRQVSRFPRVFADQSRFARASVVITGEALQGMSGLDLLEALRGTPISKLLVSGIAQAASAMQALDAGLADAIAPHEDIAEPLQRLQIDYFRRLMQPFEPALTHGDARFIRNPAFAVVFTRFVERYKVIEHCVLMQPPGILGLDASGNRHILLVADDDYRQASFEIALAEGAPPQLLRCLLHAKSLAVFPTINGFYSRQVETCWSHYVWPSECLGAAGWRWAVINKPDVVQRVCDQVASYAAHRQQRLN